MAANKPTKEWDRPRPCPHGCRPSKSMWWVDDSWYCPACGDEWPQEPANGGVNSLP